MSFGIGYDTPTNALLSELSTMPGIKWARAMELVLLDSMVDSVRKGLRAESGFKKTAWIERSITNDHDGIPSSI